MVNLLNLGQTFKITSQFRRKSCHKLSFLAQIKPELHIYGQKPPKSTQSRLKSMPAISFLAQILRCNAQPWTKIELLFSFLAQIQVFTLNLGLILKLRNKLLKRQNCVLSDTYQTGFYGKI